MQICRFIHDLRRRTSTCASASMFFLLKQLFVTDKTMQERKTRQTVEIIQICHIRYQVYLGWMPETVNFLTKILYLHNK